MVILGKTFDFVPEICIITGYNTSSSDALNNFICSLKEYESSYVQGARLIMQANQLTTTYELGYGFGYFDRSNPFDNYGKKSADGKTFSWYIKLTDDGLGP